VGIVYDIMSESSADNQKLDPVKRYHTERQRIGN
jgi:hypothetical protein